MKVPRRKAAVGLAIVAAVLGGGAAAAMWQSNGVGSGRAKSLQAVDITVSAASGAADLYPGFTQGDVSFTLANTNPYDVTFTSMTPGTVASSDPTNCPASNVSVVGASGLSIAVPAGAAAKPASIADVVSMDAAAPDGCQGVSFTIGLTLSGAQS